MASKHASPILIVKLQWGQLAVFDDVLTNVGSVSLFVHGHLALRWEQIVFSCRLHVNHVLEGRMLDEVGLAFEEAG